MAAHGGCNEKYEQLVYPQTVKADQQNAQPASQPAGVVLPSVWISGDRMQLQWTRYTLTCCMLHSLRNVGGRLLALCLVGSLFSDSIVLATRGDVAAWGQTFGIVIRM